MGRRLFLLGIAGGALTACVPRRNLLRVDAVVSRTPQASAGAPVYPTIGAALAAAPPGDTPYRIRITRGRWHEKLVVDRAGVELIGDDREACVITFDAAAGHLAPDGQPWGTWRCASLIVRAANFRARRLTIENAFDYPGHLRLPRLETIGSNGAQGVALMLDAGADHTWIEDVDLIGHQDTLFVDAGRSLFRHCRIRGSVDFVFGAGQAWFERCELVSRYRHGKERQGYVAVPSTLATQQHGLVFHRCHLGKEAAVPGGSVALGRPWRPTRTFADGRYGDPAVQGAATFLECSMDDHIDSAGWDAMAYTARDGSRVLFQPADARLTEFRSRGAGAAVTPTRPQLAEAAAAAFRIEDWMR